MKVSVPLPWPSQDLSPNGRRSIFAKNSRFQEAKTLAAMACRKALREAGVEHVATDEKVRVRLVVTPPDRRRRDEDNLLASCKAYLDGIALGLGLDDCRFHFLEQEWMPADKKIAAVEFSIAWSEKNE